MSDPVISVEGLSKRYVIEHESRHDNLRDTLHHTARKLWRRFRWGTGFRKEEFWALRDVSFEVKRGEVVGIIGRNGAGKSTLLKILSRITEPTEGTVTIKGRVASLLEVGTGFHPELSGRENIFLNGAILGMSRAEIRRKFDEIVAFAEVEKFLDTQVKHYSSGMYVRLAFAVAAHLEPEILIVDEVLAVGDAAFQQKCLGKIKSVSSKEGRTVLFVSHNMVPVQQLCGRVIHMSNGRVAGIGAPKEQIQGYIGGAAQVRGAVDLQSRPRSDSLLGRLRYQSVDLAASDQRGTWQLGFGEPLVLTLRLTAAVPIEKVELGVVLATLQGLEILSTLSSWTRENWTLSAGEHIVRVSYPAVLLAPGSYRLGLGARSDRGFEDHIPEVVEITVVPSETARYPNLAKTLGVLIQPAEFSTEGIKSC
jgi:lipopolysaccharide transport system ATP-binding protein